MSLDPLASFIETLCARAFSVRHRYLVAVQGPDGWIASRLAALWSPQGNLQGCWISQTPPSETAYASDWLRTDRSRQVLGQEFDRVLIDARSGLEPDALGALSGTVRAGGCLLLLLPPYEAAAATPFQRWLQHCLEQPSGTDRAAWLLTPETDPTQLRQLLKQLPLNESAAVPKPEDPDCLSDDQALAVAKICRVLQGHRRRPLVISADRGRGKSAALGIAAARLMQQQPCRIRLTAPSKAAVASLLERLYALLPDAEIQRQGNRVVCGASELEFVALDRLLSPAFDPQLEAQAGVAELLLVDEAAAIPAPMLEQLLRRHARVVFATTTHGYEGTGRGFLIRFSAALQQLTPQWRRFELQQPIRWNCADPLENWVFSALMLDAEPAQFQESEFKPSDLDGGALSFRCWESAQLLANPSVLKQLFGLLVLAHYRTSPSDLRDLLDDPARQVWLLSESDRSGVSVRVLGVVLVATEGGFDASLSRQIWLGKRRLHGHLLPQVLCAQAGWSQAAELSYWRVVRIAVSEPLRRCGFGRVMLQRLLVEARQQPSIDVLGTSFGASVELLPFWSSQGLQPLRLGLKPDGRSGSVSLLYARGCSDRAESLLRQIQRQFSRDLPLRLQRDAAMLEPELVCALLADSLTAAHYPLEPQDRQDIESFLLGNRGLQLVEAALQRWMWQLLPTRPGPADQSSPVLNPDLDLELRALLVRYLLQQWPLERLLSEYGLSGERQLQQRLKPQLLPLWNGSRSLAITDGED
ncbi:tRNA(Met) cytidine acetyltransferase TmcA [Motiliproteus coralliicola]|uniref:tRNA(Met) cytidine acetyltransferase TmcA n=1 Tax=Motiliproteus coralliicola TaxID=2283196 RepID=UPI0014021A6F|nr:GNAT family N-acetyltransferase [Motiliproteus coralliicola]